MFVTAAPVVATVDDDSGDGVGDDFRKPGADKADEAEEDAWLMQAMDSLEDETRLSD